MPNNIIALAAQIAETRTEQFMGSEHLVVPVIALVEQVLHSSTSETPELALGEEFGKLPTAWNGRPVVVNHPEMNGKKVSANLPNILETEMIGQIFNAVYDDNKLKMEAWINLERVNEIGGTVQETVNKLQNNEMTEVSTGLFADVEKKSGKFNNKEYNGIWRNIVPDHLAILSDSIGACSVADGCGAPRVNEKGELCSCEKCVALRTSVTDDAEETGLDRFVSIFFNKKIKGDRNVRNIIQAALTKKFGGEAYLEVVHENSVVYSTYSGYFETEYSLADDGAVSFGSKSNSVIPQVSFIPMKVNSEGKVTMDKEKFISDLISNEGTKFSADDKDWLMALEEKQLEKFASMLTPKEPKDEEPKPKANEEKPKVSQETDPQKFLETAPPELREMFNEGLRTLNAKRDYLIKGIVANKSNKFTEDQLKAMELSQLENIATLAHVEEEVDYSGRGSHRTQETTESNAPMPMPKVFEAPAKSKAA